MLPTWLFFVCLLAAWWANKQPARWLLVILVSCGFTASAAMEAVLLGGAPILPALFFVPFIWFAVLKHLGSSALLSGFSLKEAGGWLFAYTLWAILSAIFMPRIFAGDFLVFTTSRGSGQDLAIEQIPLGPNSTNVTQATYIALGLGIYLAIRALSRTRDSSTWLLRAVYAVSIANALLVIVDAAQRIGNIELGLSYIRNARYAILSQSVGGWARLQGSFAEPAALAGFTIVPFAILFTLWLKGVQPARTGLLALVNAFILLATLSTTAIVSIAVVLCIIALCVSWNQFNMDRTAIRFGPASIGILLLISVTCIILLWWPSWFQRFIDLAHVMVFEKMDSSSGQERLAWTIGTWRNFLDSYGMGSGTGSARGSSFPLVILGNTGVIGLTLMAIFLGHCVFSSKQEGASNHAADSSESTGNTILFAFRMGLIARLVPLSLSGTMVDPGPLFYVLTGVVAGLLATKLESANRDSQTSTSLNDLSRRSIEGSSP